MFFEGRMKTGVRGPKRCRGMAESEAYRDDFIVKLENEFKYDSPVFLFQMRMCRVDSTHPQMGRREKHQMQ